MARDALAWCRAAGLAAHVNHLERMVIPADDDRADDYSRWSFGPVLLVPDVDAWVRGPVTKVIAVGDAAAARAACSTAPARTSRAGPRRR